MLEKTRGRRIGPPIDKRALALPMPPRTHVPVDKSVLMFGEERRIVDQAYRDSAKDRSCAWPGCPNPPVLAHIRAGLKGGASLKPGDDCSEFLCTDHNTASDTDGVWFWLALYVEQRRAAYRAWKAGR